MTAMTALSRLLSLLDLVKTGDNGFEGLSPSEPVQRVFGGQVLAQALVAASRTVGAGRLCHSLHAYFLRPGDPVARWRQLQRPAGGGPPEGAADFHPGVILPARRGRF